MAERIKALLPDSIRRLGQRTYASAVLAYRRAVPRDVLLPGFIVLGAMKGGSSALFYYLGQHPQVRLAIHKEPHYFDLHYDRGLDWYKAQFPATTPGLISGEGSPYYLFHPLAPARMKEALPDVHIIAVLRDPVSRAYSHYHHMLRGGRETLSFEEAIAAEPERLKGEAERIIAEPGYFSPEHMYHSYLRRGHYAEQIEAWQAHFPPEQMLILGSEEFFANPGEAYSQTLRFLGLDDRPLKRAQQMNKGEYAPMNPATRDRLREYFRAHDERLYRLLDRDFGWDKKETSR